MLKHYLTVMVASAALLAPLPVAHAQNQGTSTARGASVHECSALAGRYSETTYGNTEFYLYRSCMARQGQVE